jgi:hypothetical protein
VNVFVEADDMRSRDGLATPLQAETTVRVVAAIAGG